MAGPRAVRVTILNQSYSVVTDSDAAELEALAQRVDQIMTAIASQAGNVDSTRTAVLACLHLADELRSREQELTALKSRIAGKAREFTDRLDDVISEKPRFLGLTIEKQTH